MSSNLAKYQSKSSNIFARTAGDKSQGLSVCSRAMFKRLSAIGSRDRGENSHHGHPFVICFHISKWLSGENLHRNEDRYHKNPSIRVKPLSNCPDQDYQHDQDIRRKVYALRDKLPHFESHMGSAVLLLWLTRTRFNGYVAIQRYLQFANASDYIYILPIR